ncbi:unnamed protein product [[Candida] boidinii]|nr:unnamed protein product [[Candida] boidinii]
MTNETESELQKLTYQIESVLTYFKKETWGVKPDYRIGALEQFLTYAPNDCWIRARKGRLYVRLGAWLRFDIKHLNLKSIDLVLKCLIKSHLEKEKLDSLLITKPLRFMNSKSEFEKFIPLISKLITGDLSLNKSSTTTTASTTPIITKSPSISNASINSTGNLNSNSQAPKLKNKNQVHVKLISNKKDNDQISKDSNDGNNNSNNGSNSNIIDLSNSENSNDSNSDKSKNTTTVNKKPWSFSRYMSDQKQKQNEIQLKQQEQEKKKMIGNSNSGATSTMITSNENEIGGENLTRSQGGILRRLVADGLLSKQRTSAKIGVKFKDDDKLTQTRTFEMDDEEEEEEVEENQNDENSINNFNKNITNTNPEIGNNFNNFSTNINNKNIETNKIRIIEDEGKMFKKSRNERRVIEGVLNSDSDEDKESDEDFNLDSTNLENKNNSEEKNGFESVKNVPDENSSNINDKSGDNDWDDDWGTRGENINGDEEVSWC